MQHLKKPENARQIPKTKKYTANKDYYDYLFGYLQSISHWDGGLTSNRYIYKSSINFSTISKICGKSRQTISKKFKAILEGTEQNEKSGVPPLIRQVCDRYEIIAIEPNLAMLVPQDTLQLLLDTVKDDVISIYVYLFNRYFASGQNSFQITFPELRAVVGAGVKNRDNDKFNNILRILQKIGLLKYQQTMEKEISGQIKTHTRIVWMTNYIED